MISLKDKIKVTYSLNLLQVMNMSVLAFLVPIFIGFAEYGEYLKYFSIAGVAAGVFETMGVKFLVKKDVPINLGPTLFGFFAIAAFVFAVNYLIFDVCAAFLSMLVFISLGLRSVVYGLMINNSGSLLFRNSITFETTAFFAYGLVFIAAICGLWKNNLVPLFMLIAASVGAAICAVCFFRGRKLVMFRAPQKATGGSVMSTLTVSASRHVEDVQFTLLPMIIAIFYGSEFAGVYKFYSSIIKFLSKLYPLRYEILVNSSDFFNKTNINRVAIITGIFFLFSFVFYRLYIMVAPYFDFPVAYAYMVLLAPLIVFNFVFSPYVFIHKSKLIIVSILLFLVLTMVYIVQGYNVVMILLIYNSSIAILLMSNILKAKKNASN